MDDALAYRLVELTGGRVESGQRSLAVASVAWENRPLPRGLRPLDRFPSLGLLLAAGAFAAGNKRTAWRTATEFVEANGYALDLPPDPRHAIERLLGYFDGRLGQTGVVAWFRLWMTPR